MKMKILTITMEMDRSKMQEVLATMVVL